MWSVISPRTKPTSNPLMIDELAKGVILEESVRGGE